MIQHDVFISYSTMESRIAMAICHYLEENHIRCWMAPRDIPPAMEYAEVIEHAIRDARFFVIIVSSASQRSQWVRQETNLAISEGKIVLPFKIDNSELTGSMRFYLNDKHWIDAFPNPEEKFFTIRDAIRSLMSDSTAATQKAASTDVVDFKIRLRFLREFQMFVGIELVYCSMFIPVVLLVSQGRRFIPHLLSFIGIPLVIGTIGGVLATGISVLKLRHLPLLLRKSISEKGVFKSISSLFIYLFVLWIRVNVVILCIGMPLGISKFIIANALSFKGEPIALVLTLLVNLLCVGTFFVMCFKVACALFMENYSKFRITNSKTVKWFLLLVLPPLCAWGIINVAARFGMMIDAAIIH